MTTVIRWPGYETGAPLNEAAIMARVRRLERLARLMDSAFRIPGTRQRIGLDSLIGLIPGVGDIGTAAVSVYLVREAIRLGVPKRTVGLMVANVGVDLLVGAVPVLGDLFDVGFKANLRNVKLLKDALQRKSDVGEELY